MSIDQIAGYLSVSRSTINSWVSDIALDRPPVAGGSRSGNLAMQAKYRELRERAYRDGCVEFDDLARDVSFRDFICMYVGEGTKRDRNMVAICNSDPAVIRLAHFWIARLSSKPITYSVQFHADQDLDELKSFWAVELGVDSSLVKTQRKSNSNQMGGRTWRSSHGVLMIRSCDTYFRARLEAWMDRLRNEWAARSPLGGDG